MAGKARVRLIDIANRLNLSKVSVSKALRNHPDISKDTRDLIKRTAAEMGYVPNLLARSLSSQRTCMIGVVVPKVAHVFFSSVLDGIIDRAASDGYEVVVTISQEQADLEEKHIETLLSMHVDGMLVSVSEDALEHSIYDRVRKLGVPLVFFDRSPDGLGFSTVRVDDEGGAYDGVSRLLDEGAEVVAHLAGYGHTSIGRDRRRGYERALKDRGIEPRDEWVVEGGFGEKYGYEGYKELHARGVKPDAVFCSTFPVTMGMVMAMREIDPALEASTLMLTFDTGGMQRLAAFPYFCIRQDAIQLGEKAFEEVLRVIDTPDSEAREIILPTPVYAPGELADANRPWLGAPPTHLTEVRT
jgi:LacI family transcriptional regulator